MESFEEYNFSIFRPRNLHGKKNRNVILTMLLIWAVAVFGFQFLLRAVEKPAQEKALVTFLELWPSVRSGTVTPGSHNAFLTSLVMARGKNTLKPEEQKVISDAITCFTYRILPDSVESAISGSVLTVSDLRNSLASLKGEQYLEVKKKISDHYSEITDAAAEYTGFTRGSLESSILTYSLQTSFPSTMSDASFDGLEDIMKLYMTHNQSFLTDSRILGFPFHYFYTAVFLLILFVILCIVYNILVEWRLKKEGVVE
ncbi:MAG: DUF4212 domain-containing protein [Bacteroidales bacterium]|nr:DUF4212 domain-containing protein [Bacteroidales bacterium]